MNFSTPGMTPTKKSNSLKNACSSLLLVIALMLVGQMSFAQVAGDYRSNGTPVDLNSATNWQVFSGGSFITATLPPNGNLVSGNTVTILTGHTWNNPGPSPTIPAGVTVVHQGTTGTFSTAAGNKINNNGTIVHQTTSSNGNVLAGVNNNTGSTFIFRGSSALAITPSLSARTFYNVTFESTSGVWTAGAAAGANALVINGNLDIGGSGAGTVVADQSGGTMAITVAGNISVKASCTYKPPTGIFTISGNITNAGTFTLNAASSVVFDGSTTLSGANLVSFANGFTVNATKTFANSQNGNIVASGKTATINGTFQVNEGSWTGSTGTYSYNATTGSLVFNNSSGVYGPIDNSHLYWPSANGPFNVTVQNTGGINLGVARTVGGAVITSKGIAGAGNLTVNGTLQINGGGFLTGTPTYGGSSTLIYNTTSYTTTDNEFPVSGVKNVTVTAPTGTNTVTLNNDKTISGTFAIGAHTVNGGKSINAGIITMGAGTLVAGTLTTSSLFTCTGSSSISLTGSWNVAGFSRSTSTVNFTGSGNLSVNTTFYNLTNSAGTRSVQANFAVENTLLASGGTIVNSIGSVRLLTMTGAASTINITTGAINGTDQGAGNDLTLQITGALTNLTGNATVNDDHEKKFFGVIVNNGSTLALSRGILCRYGTFTVNGTLQINANGYVQTNPTSSVVPSYNASTGSLTYNNGGPFTTAGEWPASNSPVNVTTQSPGTNVTLTADRTAGTVVLGDGTKITTSTNKIIVTGLISNSLDGYVNGNLQRSITGTGFYSFPIGTTSTYAAVGITFNTLGTPGSLTVFSTDGASSNYPSSLSAVKRIARFWTVINSGVAGFSASAILNYAVGDLVGGASVSLLKPYKFDGPSTFSYPSSTSSSLQFTENGLTSFSEFGAGECGTVTVNPITGGGASLCIGATQQLASTTPGGVWTSDAPGIASVDGTGLVTANLNGTTTIHYTVTDISGCTGEATQSVTVLPNYTITATAGSGGSISPNGVTTLCSGNNQTYTITATDACHVISDVVVDGVSQGAVGTYTFTNVTANHTISASFSLITYTITVTAGANGSITPGTGSVNCGDNATYTISPNACYSIADVVVDGVSQGAVGTYTFTNVTAAHTISASFVLNTYTITVTAGANGSVTPATGSVNCGDNATYAITPDACYSIADVVVDGVSQGAVGTYTFTNVTANHTISATFALSTYTITVTAGANGSITPATGSVNCGDNATYTITPDACYVINEVVVDGVSAGTVGTYTFTNVTANHTISATFVLATYTITVTNGAHGSINPQSIVKSCGSNQTFTMIPDDCYSVADVVVDGVSQGAVGTYTFTNITAAHTISASFVLNTYTVTVTAGANGSITPATGSVNCGDNATYTITANTCYSIADVVVDGVSQGAVGTYTFTNVTANHTISATFILNTYTITVTAGANGSITPATGSVNCGDNATYTITANTCYSIADVVVDGVSQGAVGTYTFTNVIANHTISATFVINTFTITVTAGANGSITPATGSVNCGDNATYTITADACYSIADVVVDGVSQGAVGTYTFTNVTANHTISATFTLNTYTITVTSGANGSITPATGSVNCGDNATYTITPDACYSIADVVVDGVSQGAVGTYTFTNVTANHTISATFVATTYTITVTAGANGSITPATGSVNCGDNATYTITPDACYAIADVVVDGVSQGAVGTYTFTNVTANHTISATFAATTYTITVTAGANGSITPATGSVNCGDNATYTISADACYSIADVVVDGVSQGAVGTYTFTNVTANHTISATFVLNTYTITVTAGANGSITPATGSVNCGDNATYTITANACYAIADVVVDGVSQGAVGTYTFTNVTANHTISATFVATTYTITVTAGANGSITPATGSVNCGDNATYTISADACYTIADVVVDGVSQGAVGTYTFTNVTANHTISATFVVTTYTIIVTSGANGSITPGTGSVNCGSNATYNITPVACYHVANVIVDGSSVGAVTTYTFTNVTANHTISATFAINTALAAPVVTGPTNVCPYIGTGDQVVYTATSAGATGFTWVIPPTNVTIISGQGTANLTVTFQNGFAAQANKQLRVTATSACGNSPLTIYYLLVQTPSTPQPIVGNTNVCPIIGTANTYSYTIPSVPGATSYAWNAQPVNAVITHPNGAGVNDTTVNVSFTNSFTSSSITVAAANGCGTSSARSLALIKTNPSQPGLISGPTNACAYMAPGGTPASYSIVPVAGATSYTWTVPAGAIGLTGQGSASISFTYPNGFVSGTVSVTATNGCGTSVARNLSITKLNPSTPSVIDVIQVASCPDRIYTYTLSAMPANATSVQWTVPAGGTITSGQGTTSITVSYSVASVNGNVTAQAINNCGSSTIRISAVKLGSCQGERAITTKGTSVPATTTPVESMQVSLFPNPTVSDFKLQVVTAGKQTINVRIMDAQGRSIKTFVVMPYQTIHVGADLKAGAYIMEVRQGNEVRVTKLLKF